MKRIPFFILMTVLLTASVISAQEPYKRPSQEIIDMVTAPAPPMASLSPTGEDMLLVTYESLPPLSHMAQPLLRLAGMRITPLTNSRQQNFFYTRLVIKRIQDGAETEIPLPPGSRLGNVGWSHDGRRIAFTRFLDTGIELWAADRATGKAKVLTGPVINAVLSSGFSWMPDGRLLVSLVPEGRGGPPEKPPVPTGPNVQETSGKFAKVWTYQDLLQNPHDEALFEYYAKAQLALIDAGDGGQSLLGKPGIFFAPDPSPDGRFLFLHRMKKPFSHHVPFYYFTQSLEIWDMTGGLVHTLADLPLADDVPMRGVAKGPRSVEWRPLKDARLVWVEALDEGDPEKQVPHRDRIMTLAAPFSEAPQEIMKIQHRYSGLSWLQKPGEAFLTEYDWKRRWRTSWHVSVDDPTRPPKKISDLSIHDRYNDPGRPVHTRTGRGEYIVMQDKDWIYLSGSGSSPQGDRPFLDRMNLKTDKKERLFHCDTSSYERFVGFLGKSRKQIVTQHQTKTDPPNYYLVTLKNRKRAALSDYQDPAPRMTGVRKQLIKYSREDGVPLSGTLYLPPDYREGERLPLLVWAYPIEYSDPATAGQVRSSPHRFTFYRGTSQLFFVTQGYAVLDSAQMPIVGDPKTMNDTFVDQIVAAAKAAIDKLDEMGVIDPERVAVGGHSYGAFMTANLLAHCDLFAAGVARSGAYNRTLTPFGFQSERRTLWEAPEIYFKVSPFMHAHKINEPILLIHGEIDNNSGTFPIQSRRLFHALKGHGATARLVFLPYESHGYQAKESVLHVLAEMFEWCDKYVKQRK